jgi:hypothetical protein
MTYGDPAASVHLPRNSRLGVPIVAVCAGLLLGLGLWMPASLVDAIGRAAAIVSG